MAQGVDNRVYTLLSLDPGSPVAHTAMATPKAGGGSTIERRSRKLPAVFSKLDILGWPLARRWLQSQLKADAPDVLVSHFGPDGCLAAPVARRLGIPHIVFFYGYDVNVMAASRSNVWSYLYPKLFASADSICTTSEYLAARVKALGAPAEKLKVIHVGIDLSFFSWSDPAARFDGRTIRLLHVGRLTAKKSPLQLLRAVHEAIRLIPALRFELTIAGDGELARRAARSPASSALGGAGDLHRPRRSRAGARSCSPRITFTRSTAKQRRLAKPKDLVSRSSRHRRRDCRLRRPGTTGCRK